MTGLRLEIAHSLRLDYLDSYEMSADILPGFCVGCCAHRPFGHCLALRIDLKESKRHADCPMGQGLLESFTRSKGES